MERSLYERTSELDDSRPILKGNASISRGLPLSALSASEVSPTIVVFQLAPLSFCLGSVAFGCCYCWLVNIASKVRIRSKSIRIIGMILLGLDTIVSSSLSIFITSTSTSSAVTVVVSNRLSVNPILPKISPGLRVAKTTLSLESSRETSTLAFAAEDREIDRFNNKNEEYFSVSK